MTVQKAVKAVLGVITTCQGRCIGTNDSDVTVVIERKTKFDHSLTDANRKVWDLAQEISSDCKASSVYSVFVCFASPEESIATFEFCN